MTVVLTSGNYGIRKRTHPFSRDAHGTPVPPGLGSVVGPWPGDANRQADGSYSIRLDPRLWPVKAGDVVTGPNSEVWLVVGQPLLFRNNASPDVDYVGVTGTLEPPEVI